MEISVKITSPSEITTHAQIEWIKPARYERGEPVARKVGMHKRLLDAGRIEPAHYEWCERYCLAIEALHGARPGKPVCEAIDEQVNSAIYDRATAAASFVRRAHARLTPRQRELLMCSVVNAYRDADTAIAIGIYPRDAETIERFRMRVMDRIARYTLIAIVVSSGISLVPRKQPKQKSEQTLESP